MNDQIQTVMVEATRLTRAGRVAEATALIQHTLGEGAPLTGWPGRADAPIEAEVHIREDPPPWQEPTKPGREGGSPGLANTPRVVAPQVPAVDLLQLPGELRHPAWRGPLVMPGR